MPSTAEDPVSASPAPAVWRDIDGRPLPFSTDEDALVFLSTAEIVDLQPIGEGVTGPLKATLRAGGVVAHASFRHHHDERRNVRLEGGRRERWFLDSYRNEVPAFRLARHLGLRYVPPAVLRAVDGRRGSLQLWVEGALMETERQGEGIDVPPEAREFVNHQTWDLRVFDNLVRNIDRNGGNVLWDDAWRMWWIDCTRCFSRSRDLPDPTQLRRVSRGLWEGLQALDVDSLREALGESLYGTQVRSLLARRDAIVRRLAEEMRQHGEGTVLFSAGPPPTLPHVE